MDATRKWCVVLSVWVLLAGLVRGAEDSGPTTETLIERLSAPIPEAVPCPAGAETELWVLAGQSNMQGIGNVDETEQPDPRIWLFNVDLEWIPAKDPLHRLWSSRMPIDRMLYGMPSIKQQAGLWWRAEHNRLGPSGSGVGPGLPFARELIKEINKPIGLLACAHGATNLAQWDPGKKTSDTLYGAMLERIRIARAGGRGGKLRGILWYQGESDGLGATTFKRADGTTESLDVNYERRFVEWIDVARRDLKEPELPVLIVQIGRFVVLQKQTAPGWEMVREAQRRIPAQRRNVWTVSALDLTMVDDIHLDTPGQRRLGRRLAEVALREVYGLKNHATAITLDSISVEQPDPKMFIGAHTIRVRFKGVNGKLQSGGRPMGFALRRPAPQGTWTSDVNNIVFDKDDPSVVLVKTSTSWSEPTEVIYGPGINPDINIVDSMDMPVPAFGPVPIKLK